MEGWNNGKMGLTPPFFQVVFLLPIIPLFHHSNLPKTNGRFE